MKYTIKSIQNHDDITPIEDALILPPCWLTEEELREFGRQIITRGHEEINTTKPSYLSQVDHEQHLGLMVLGFLSLRHDSNELLFLEDLPPRVRAVLRASRAIRDSEGEAILPTFPNMGMGYIILGRTGTHHKKETLTSEAIQLFGLRRLMGIRQLAYLHDPILRDIGLCSISLMYSHTRFVHSLDTSVVCSLIAANLGLNEDEARVLRFAGLTHDTLTPAGGDATKLVDPARFDEDANYPSLFKSMEGKKFAQKWKLNLPLLYETILGKGILGQCLDLADKTSYIARDLEAFVRGSPTSLLRCQNANLYTLSTFPENHQNCCALWESVSIVDGKLVILDTDRLAHFLKLRAFLFRELYYNPFSRFFEYLIGKGAIKIMYTKGDITAEELLQHDDAWLNSKIEHFFETRYILEKFHNLERARLEEQNTLEDAYKRAAEFDGDPNIIAIVDDFKCVSSDGIDRFLVKHKEAIVPFSVARPVEARMIRDLMTFKRCVRVYFFVADDLEIPPHSRTRIKELFKSLRPNE